MKKIITLSAFVALVALFVGCKTSGTGSKGDAELKGTRWIVEAISGEKVSIPEGGKEIYIQIEADKLSGFAGCNRVLGAALVDGKKIDLSKAATTMMACDKMELEGKFLSALRTVDSYEIKGQKLSLKSGDKVVLTFNAAVW